MLLQQSPGAAERQFWNPYTATCLRAGAGSTQALPGRNDIPDLLPATQPVHSRGAGGEGCGGPEPDLGWGESGWGESVCQRLPSCLARCRPGRIPRIC